MSYDSDIALEYAEWVSEDAPEGAVVLDDVKAFLSRFVAYLTTHALVAHVLWIAHCWLMDHWESTPRLGFLSSDRPGAISGCPLVQFLVWGI